MKKLFILVLLSVLVAGNAFAQEIPESPPVRKHVVGLNVVGTCGGRIKVKYEYLYSDRISFGGIVTGCFGQPVGLQDNEDYYEGFYISPITRYYFGKSRRYYIQAKLNIGQ